MRIIGDSRENERRINEEVSRQGRRQKLLYEAESSARQNAAVAMKWSALFDKEIPQELLHEIELQKDTCERIIQSKDRLIKEFKTELKAKDDEYVKSLKKQNDDVELLLERMTRQFTSLRKTFDDELEEIETSFMQERAELMHSNQHGAPALMQKRLDKEEQVKRAAFPPSPSPRPSLFSPGPPLPLSWQYMEARRRRVDEDQRQLEGQRVQDNEDLNILKIKLETEIQTLEQQLEEMRATYQLNQEKLDYNYRVLVERDSENTNTIKQQKKKLTRMADILSNLKARYAREERRFKNENQELTEEYKRITEQFKDLQSKFQHFEVADTKRYRDVWQMNEEAVTDLMRKVLQADKIIHEQQLGLSWLPPSEHIFHAGGEGGVVPPRARPPLRLRMKAALSPAGRWTTRTSSTCSSCCVTRRASSSRVRSRSCWSRCRRTSRICSRSTRSSRCLVSRAPATSSRCSPTFSRTRTTTSSFIRTTRSKRSRPSWRSIRPSARAAATRQRRRSHRQGGWSGGHTAGGARVLGAYVGDHQRQDLPCLERLEKALHKYDALLKSRAHLIGEVGDLQRQNGELKALLNQYLSSKPLASAGGACAVVPSWKVTLRMFLHHGQVRAVSGSKGAGGILAKFEDRRQPLS